MPNDFSVIFRFVTSPTFLVEQAMRAEAPFYLTTGECLFLTGKTLRLLGAECDVFQLFDKDGTPVLNEEFYEVTAEGIERIAD
jgi:hypothetical protein